jgi:hypothetical protein
MNHYVTLALTNRKSSVHLHALYSPRTALRMFTPRRDHLLFCLLYRAREVKSRLCGKTAHCAELRTRHNVTGQQIHRNTLQQIKTILF